MKVCQRCGAETAPEDKFCTICGSNEFAVPIIPEAPDAPVPPVAEAPVAPMPEAPIVPPVMYTPPVAPVQPVMPAQPAVYAAPIIPAPPVMYPSPAAPVNPYYMAPPPQPEPSGAAIQTLKKNGRSVVALLAAILFTAVMGLYLVTAVQNFMWMFNKFFSPTANEIITELITFLFTFVPQLLICIGLWLFFAACMSRHPRMSTTGLTLTKAGTVFYMVYICIITFLVLIVGIIALIGSAAASNYLGNYMNVDFSGAIVGLAITMLVLLAVMILLIIYYASIMKTINSAKSVIKTGQPNSRVSAYVPVINIIIALFGLGTLAASYFARTTLWTSIFDALRGAGMSYGDINSTMSYIMQIFPPITVLGILPPLSNAGFLIVISVGIFMYRSAMQRLIYPVTNMNPGYGQYPQVPYQ